MDKTQHAATIINTVRNPTILLSLIYGPIIPSPSQTHFVIPNRRPLPMRNLLLAGKLGFRARPPLNCSLEIESLKSVLNPRPASGEITARPLRGGRKAVPHDKRATSAP